MTRVRRAALAAAALLGLAACTPVGFGLSPSASPSASPSPSGPRSVLSGGARTCAGDGAPCTRSGRVRWVVPLLGPYHAAGTDALGTSSSLESVAVDGDGSVPNVVVLAGVAVLQSGDRTLGVDLATGRVRWQRHDAGWAGDRLVAVNGRVVAAQSRGSDRAGRAVILTPRTGRAVVVRQTPTEIVLDSERPSRDLLLIGGPPDAGRVVKRTVRAVDVRTGRTRWRIALPGGRDDDVSGSTLYVGDYLELPGRDQDGNQRYGIRHVYRVDLDRGRRLPDVPVPARLHGEYYLQYVAGRAIVIGSAPVDGDVRLAFTPSGKVLDDVPKLPAGDDDPAGDRATVAGAGSGGTGLQYVRANGWTGPAMRAVAYRTPVVAGRDPEVVLAVACAPDGVRPAALTDPQPGTLCDAPRFFAVTW